MSPNGGLDGIPRGYVPLYAARSFVYRDYGSRGTHGFATWNGVSTTPEGGVNAEEPGKEAVVRSKFESTLLCPVGLSATVHRPWQRISNT